MPRRICSSATSAASTDRTRTTETPKPTSPAKSRAPDDDPDVQRMLTAHDPAKIPSGGQISRRFAEPVPLTRQLAEDLCSIPKERSTDDHTDRPGRHRGLVPDGKPASVRGGDAPPGGGAVARYRRHARGSPGHPGKTHLEAGPHRSRCDPQDRPGGERRRPG